MRSTFLSPLLFRDAPRLQRHGGGGVRETDGLCGSEAYLLRQENRLLSPLQRCVTAQVKTEGAFSGAGNRRIQFTATAITTNTV